MYLTYFSYHVSLWTYQINRYIISSGDVFFESTSTMLLALQSDNSISSTSFVITLLFEKWYPQFLLVSLQSPNQMYLIYGGQRSFLGVIYSLPPPPTSHPQISLSKLHIKTKQPQTNDGTQHNSEHPRNMMSYKCRHGLLKEADAEMKNSLKNDEAGLHFLL